MLRKRFGFSKKKAFLGHKSVKAKGKKKGKQFLGLKQIKQHFKLGIFVRTTLCLENKKVFFV
jgi:hypothetical protein